ncbi:Rep [uncultured virus]|uniref:Rep n=1 Tax=uncultured virus TaxID=340016 RepID=A0A2K9LS87_9VIRU|nr:Rep [uncultured virus]
MQCNTIIIDGLEMAQCLIGGNMCDDCFAKGLKQEREKLNCDLRKWLIDTGIVKEAKPVPPIQAFPEIEDVQGVNSVYELTLTTTKDDPYELRQYLDKIVKSKMFDVKAFKACMELQENGNPHIHAMLWSGKKVLNSNHIKTKIKFPYRFTLKFVRRQQNYYNYILKEKDSPIIIEYCQRKGIPQEWHTENMPPRNVGEQPLLNVGEHPEGQVDPTPQ